MELSKQVCSRELAEKMKELGFPVDSHFFWQKCENDDEDDKEYGEWYVVDKGELYFKNYGNEIPAYSVAELGEMMPRSCYTKREIVGNWACASTEIVNAYPMPCQLAPTEADARAKMLIYLAENGLIDPKSIKI